MEQIGYGEHVAHTVKGMPYEAAIRTEDVAKQLAKKFALPYDRAKTITNVKLKRMADKGEIKRLQKGIYCHVKQTAFGKVVPSIDKVLIKTATMHNGTKIGYESGAYLLNRLGLTTLIPLDIEITTNHYDMKLPADCHFKLRKPHVNVTNENWKYIQLIDLVRELPRLHTDAENPKQLLAQYAKNQQLDALTLIFMARRHYSQKTVLALIDLLMEA